MTPPAASTGSRPPAAGERRAWGWLAHLRAGGTTPWDDWAGEADASATHGRLLPGAQQLELLRRVNAAGRPSAGLVGRVLAASAPGRGRPDLELAGAVEPGRFGPRPVDPAALPADELVRVATSVLADELVAADLPPVPPGATRPWRRRFRLVGDPWLADAARRQAREQGREPGGRGSVVLVLADDLATMLGHAWCHRVTGEGAPSWPDWLADAVRRDRVPPRVDVLQALRRWESRVGRDRVRLVLDPAALPRLTGTRGPLAGPPVLPADGAELARRTAPVLGLLVPPERRTRVLREVLVPRLAAAGGPPLVVPAEHERWVRTHAVRLRDAARSAGYPVVGDPEGLLPGHRDGVPEPSEEGVLALAVRLLLAADAGAGAGTDAGTGTEDDRGSEDR